MQETSVQFLGQEDSLERERLTTPVFSGFPCGSAGKESACNVGDLGLIAGLGRSPGEGKSYPLRYSGLENSMDCIVHGVTKSRSQLSDFHFHFLLVIHKWLLDLKKFKLMCLNLLKKNMICAIEWVLDSVLEHQHFIMLSCSLVWNTWKIFQTSQPQLGHLKSRDSIWGSSKQNLNVITYLMMFCVL